MQKMERGWRHFTSCSLYRPTICCTAYYTWDKVCLKWPISSTILCKHAD